ncbi:hypothetical protein Taro_011486 [Colocasia esculenta]|uniref:Uncharacterized protein n=1 Tax=Colocasia esculenta TaxID=4460 RepID=A0A843UG75_COLES|nr:hypothetical protein [Colocasia esculenta]
MTMSSTCNSPQHDTLTQMSLESDFASGSSPPLRENLSKSGLLGLRLLEDLTALAAGGSTYLERETLGMAWLSGENRIPLGGSSHCHSSPYGVGRVPTCFGCGRAGGEGTRALLPHQGLCCVIWNFGGRLDSQNRSFVDMVRGTVRVSNLLPGSKRCVDVRELPAESLSKREDWLCRSPVSRWFKEQLGAWGRGSQAQGRSSL